jgi:hypothetical protein
VDQIIKIKWGSGKMYEFDGDIREIVWNIKW